MVDIKLVKQLRDITGLGFQDCRQALDQVGDDIDAAIDHLRKTSGIKAAKKEGREVGEGIVRAKEANGKVAIMSLLCETDFVARSEPFTAAIEQMLDIVLASNGEQSDIDALRTGSLEEQRQLLVQKSGENVQLGEIHSINGEHFGVYVHSNDHIGVVVSIDKDQIDVAKDVAIHIASESPKALNEADLPADFVQREVTVVKEQAAASGKPEAVQEKMVEGRLKKFRAEHTLLSQAFVKDPNVSIEELLSQFGATVHGFVRVQIGA